MLRSLIASADQIELEVFETTTAAREWLRKTDMARPG
jgi:hypothetical protein